MYLFKRIYLRLINRNFFQFIISQDSKVYQILFNIFSLLQNSKNRIYYKNKFFYNSEMN